MARLPKNPQEAVAELGIAEGATVLCFGPAHGYAEALAEATGAKGSVGVWEPPPDYEAPKNAEAIDERPEGRTGDPVIVWAGPVPGHLVREYPAYVADGGALWVVFPRSPRGSPNPVHEADVKKALLVAGWRNDRSVPLSTDQYAVRFRKRR